MAVEWYYVKDGEKQGPFTYEAVRQLAASSQLTPDDLVWRTGTKDWVKAGTIEGLFDSTESVRASVPPPIPNSEKSSDEPTFAGSIGSSIAHAGRFASKKTQRVKITSVDLPAAYRAIGKEVYDRRQFEADFAAIYDLLDGLSKKLADAQSPVEPEPNKSLADQARDLAERAKRFAQTKSLTSRIEAELLRLGKAAFEKHGEAAASEEAVKRASSLLVQVQGFDEQTDNLAKQVTVSASEALSKGSKATATLWRTNPLLVLFASAMGILASTFVCCGGCMLLNTLPLSVNSNSLQTNAASAPPNLRTTNKTSSTHSMHVSLASKPPNRDYSRGPNGEPLRHFVSYMVDDGDKYVAVKALNGRPGRTTSGNEILGPKGEYVYHGKITWVDEIGPPSSAAMLDEGITLILKGKGEMHFWAGIPEGTLRLWHSNGERRLELPYLNGKRHGLARAWHDNGTINFELQFVDGMRQGKAVCFNSDGSKVSDGAFKDNKRDGLWTDWYWDNPMVKSTEGRWINGKPCGVHRWYSLTGELINVKTFKEAPVEGGSIVDVGKSNTVFTKRALKATGVNGSAHALKEVIPRSREDFLQALRVLGADFGHRTVSDGIEELQCIIAIDVVTWRTIFDETEILPDGYDSFIRMEYQRWRVRCSDGPVTVHGNIAAGRMTGLKVCFY